MINKLKAFLDPKKTDMTSSYFRAQLFWNPVISLAISAFLGGFHDLFGRWLSSFIIATGISNFCFGAVYLLLLIDRLLAKILNRPAPIRSKGWRVSASICSMPLGVYWAFEVMQFLGPKIGRGQIPRPTGEDYRVGLLIGTLIAVIFFVVRTRAEARELLRSNELKIKAIENESLQAQISALTAQMNPHLLFNALNTVASLVQTEPDKAEDIIVKLSELYRGVLNSSQKMVHPLAAEISICESYLAVEKARFGERLNSNIEIDPAINSRGVEVPALCLQPMVENAVKHGLSSRSSGGVVNIIAKGHESQITIRIEDNGVGLRAPAMKNKSGTGSGIKNCQDRLRLHYGNLGGFSIADKTGGGTVVSIVIPFRKETAP